MTYDQAISKLVELDVARWGESERVAAEELNRSACPTIGLALNRLAHYDIDNVDEAMAAEAKRVMTPQDRIAIRAGG